MADADFINVGGHDVVDNENHGSPSPAEMLLTASRSPVPVDNNSSQNFPSFADAEMNDDVDPAEMNPDANDDANGWKTRSEIWEQFTKVKINGMQKAKCNCCGKLLLDDPSQGTSHLRKHFNRCPKRKMKDIRQQLLQTNFNKDKKIELASNHFDQEFSRKELARMIIMHEYLMKMVEHVGFRSFLNSLNPCFKFVSRNTIKNDCVKMYEAMKEDVMVLFEKCESRVAITTDMWTSLHQKKGFMVVTAHFIDTNWNLQNRVIRFVYVPSPHTSEVLCEALVECFLDWNIVSKLSTITVDNCTTNDSMINLLLEKLHGDSLLVVGMTTGTISAGIGSSSPTRRSSLHPRPRSPFRG